MFLKTKSKQTTCNGFNLNSQNPIFSGLTENPLDSEDAVINLCRDDGFPLFSCMVADFARVIYNNGTMTLTNEPEPKPEPEPAPPEPTTEETLIELAADHEYRLCMQELGLN